MGVRLLNSYLANVDGTTEESLALGQDVVQAVLNLTEVLVNRLL